MCLLIISDSTGYYRKHNIPPYGLTQHASYTPGPLCGVCSLVLARWKYYHSSCETCLLSKPVVDRKHWQDERVSLGAGALAILKPST